MNMIRSATLPAETLELLQVLGFLHLQNGYARDAAALLEACDQAGGCRGRTLVLLALAQLRAGDPGKALSTLDRAGPDTVARQSYRVIRAQALSALGRRDEARRTLTACATARAGAAS
jgi:hypothetical protein